MIKGNAYFILDGENATLMNIYSHLAITESGRVWNYNENRFCPSLLNRDRGYYETLLIFEDGKKGFLYTNKLVAEYFVPNPNNYSEVEPINKNRFDHTPGNLRWVPKDTTPEPSAWESSLW